MKVKSMMTAAVAAAYLSRHAGGHESHWTRWLRNGCDKGTAGRVPGAGPIRFYACSIETIARNSKPDSVRKRLVPSMRATAITGVNAPRVMSVASKSKLGDDRFWLRRVEAASEMDIQLFYARASIAGRRQEASDAIDDLQTVLIREAFDGNAAALASAILLHAPRDDRYVRDMPEQCQ